MATAAEAQAAIAAAFESYISELAQAASVWETKPSGAAEGEDAWCARQVAEHIAGAGPFFGMGIARACGIDGPTPARISLPDAAAAVEETKRCHGQLVDVISKVTDDQMGIEFEAGQLGKQSVGGLMGVVSYHLKDHANQLKTLRGG